MASEHEFYPALNCLGLLSDSTDFESATVRVTDAKTGVLTEVVLRDPQNSLWQKVVLPTIIPCLTINFVSQVADPVVTFCETVVETSSLKCFAETPNKK